MNRTLVFIAACAGLAFFGVTMLALGPVLSHLGEGATALPATLSVGIIIGTAVFGQVADRFGYKWLLTTGTLLALFGVQGLSLFSDMRLLHLSMAMLGTGGGILNGSTNALVAIIYDDDKRGARLSVLGAFYCIGALLWTLLNYFSPDNFRLPLNCVSIVMPLFIGYFLLIKFPQTARQEGVSIRTTLGMLRSPALLLFSLILFFQSGFEGATGSFTPIFLQNARNFTTEAATLSLTWFTVGMLAGRFCLGAVMKRAGNSLTLVIYLAIALLGVATLGFSSDIALIYTSVALTGFGVGATYPVAFNYLGAMFRNLSGTAFSIAILIALMGQFAFNKAVGLLFDTAKYGSFPITLAAAIVAMMMILPIAKRNIKK